MVAPINANKHYVHLSNSQIASGAISTIVQVEAVAAPASANSFEVEEGSIVKAVYLEQWIYGLGASGVDTQFFMCVMKKPSDAPDLTFAQSSNLGAYPNKKNILYTTQGVIGGIDTNSIPIIKNWLLIPKGKQRMGLGDKIVTYITTLGAAIQRCGFATYKEYR